MVRITDRQGFQASERWTDSLRDMEPPCVGVFTPAAFASTPFDVQDWPLEIRPDGVTFASFGLSQVITLLREQFLVEGRWPDPS